LTDTVGFVSNLPHGLVKAFGSTLEEVAQADLLLHVVDISNPDYELQMEVTMATLNELGATDIPMIHVFNKADCVFKNLPFSDEKGLYVSAKSGLGLDLISKVVTEKLFGEEISGEFHIPYAEGAQLHEMSENMFVESRVNGEFGTFIKATCSKALFEKYKPYAIDVEASEDTVFRNYVHEEDYEKVSVFLKRIYKSGIESTNWLEARWEYMHYHPILNKEILPKIGLWESNGKLVGMVNPEGDFGDVYFAIDSEHPEIKREMVVYAENHLYKFVEGEKQLRMFIPDSDIGLKAIAATMGYEVNENYREYRGTSWYPANLLPVTFELPEGYKLHRLDEVYDLSKIDRVLWRGFDHGGEPDGDLSDRELMHSAPHFRKDMTFVVETPDGQYGAFSGIWYDEVNKTAYVEPVATDPEHRRKGLAKAAVLSCIQRCQALGATTFYVGSGQVFYYEIGFEHLFYTWPWCKSWK
jgi:GNAT superfamily N-acetyltransferase